MNPETQDWADLIKYSLQDIKFTQQYLNEWGTNFEEKEPSNITLVAGSTEMLRVAEDGFYVRGVKVEADEQEAKKVYLAFKQFLVWAELNKQ